MVDWRTKIYIPLFAWPAIIIECESLIELFVGNHCLPVLVIRAYLKSVLKDGIYFYLRFVSWKWKILFVEIIPQIAIYNSYILGRTRIKNCFTLSWRVSIEMILMNIYSCKIHRRLILITCLAFALVIPIRRKTAAHNRAAGNTWIEDWWFSLSYIFSTKSLEYWLINSSAFKTISLEPINTGARWCKS